MGKKGSNRLRAEEKQYIVDLLAQGKTQREVAETATKLFRKQITLYQVNYYSRTRREEIVEKSENEVKLALNLEASCLAYRMQKLQNILDKLFKEKPLDVQSILHTLQLADTMMDRAYRRLERKRAVTEDDSEHVVDFLEVKKKLRMTRRSIKEMKEMEKRAGWEWRN